MGLGLLGLKTDIENTALQGIQSYADTAKRVHEYNKQLKAQQRSSRLGAMASLGVAGAMLGAQVGGEGGLSGLFGQKTTTDNPEGAEPTEPQQKGGLSGAASGAAQGAQIGAMAGPGGAAWGAGIGALAGLMGGSFL